jgi:hypothetical protein
VIDQGCSVCKNRFTGLEWQCCEGCGQVYRQYHVSKIRESSFKVLPAVWRGLSAGLFFAASYQAWLAMQAGPASGEYSLSMLGWLLLSLFGLTVLHAYSRWGVLGRV